MRRILFLVSFSLCFAGALFGANDKLDGRLKDKATRGPRDQKVRVIIQRYTGASKADFDDINNNGGKVVREIRSVKTIVAVMKIAQIIKMSDNPNVKHISIDDRVRAHSGESNVVSGAVLATQTYGVTGENIGVGVIDSGIASHPDLTNVVKAVDFVDPSRLGGYDGYGHGTHVAGIVAGSGVAS